MNKEELDKVCNQSEIITYLKITSKQNKEKIKELESIIEEIRAINNNPEKIDSSSARSLIRKILTPNDCNTCDYQNVIEQRDKTVANSELKNDKLRDLISGIVECVDDVVLTNDMRIERIRKIL